MSAAEIRDVLGVVFVATQLEIMYSIRSCWHAAYREKLASSCGRKAETSLNS